MKNKIESNLQNGAALGDYLELMRLPNVFTALADAAMGFLFVSALDSAKAAWLFAVVLASSSLMYLAGVVLNDVFDVELDSRERPDRPLPSGRISLAAARWFGWSMLLAGVLLGCAAAFLTGDKLPGLIIVILLTCIVTYDAGLKSTIIGPLMMGACRMFNVLFAMSAALGLGETLQPLASEYWVVAAAIGLYITGVTWFARTENVRSARLFLTLSTIIMILGIVLLSSLPYWSPRIVSLLQEQPQRWWLLMLILGLIIGWRCLRAIVAPHAAQVQAAVAQGILSLIILDAVACFAVRGVFWAAMILLLLLPAMFFGKWIELT
jgi:4-hydroxybenzoate polyprenyltransferase